MTDKEKIEKIKNRFGLTWKEMAVKAGIASPQTFQDIRSGKISLSASVRTKLLNAFPELNEEWLFDDSGQMTREWSKQVEVRGMASLNKVNLGNLFHSADAVVYNSDCTLFPSDSLLVLKKINSVYNIVPGRIYAVENSDGIITGKVKVAPNGSDRMEMECVGPDKISMDIRMVDITSLYRVCGYIKSTDDTPVLEASHQPD